MLYMLETKNSYYFWILELFWINCIITLQLQCFILLYL